MPVSSTSQFRGKVWIYWVQLSVFGGSGLVFLALVISSWCGLFSGSDEESLRGATPALIAVLCINSLLAGLAAFNIASRSGPIIRCYREGIDCMIVGSNSLSDVPFLPGIIRAAWAILSCEGFRKQRLRATWPDFRGAAVSGIAMTLKLTLYGRFLSLKFDYGADSITYAQVELSDHPQEIADRLDQLLATPAARLKLPSWGPR